eukprot:11188420-Lingulodinium_polyedra.AAC.1
MPHLLGGGGRGLGDCTAGCWLRLLLGHLGEDCACPLCWVFLAVGVLWWLETGGLVLEAPEW